ncbi:MAG: glycosyltransferase [Fimbriimonadaceae bacterium]|nr:glycosyltransferase [Fimbriimonadaceae bacterium]
MKPRVLIIHASTGNGHISAAVAVEAALKEQGAEAKIIDGLDYAPVAFRTWYGGGYEATVRSAPEAWGWLYRISDSKGLAFRVQTFADNVFLKRLEDFIEAYAPDVVVCTHSLPQPKLSEIREETGFKIAVVVTDLYPHLMWQRGNPDWFFLPQPWSLEELSKRMPEARTKHSITGIPVHAAFGERPAVADAKTALGLDPRFPAALLTAGGIGAGDFVGAVEALTTIPDLQLLIVCGRNDRIYEKLTGLNLKGVAREVRILRRVPVTDMARLMQASDVIIGKPGGLTVSEALAAGKAFIVHEPFLIPGQEEDNARYLVEQGIGMITATNEDLEREAHALVRDAGRLEQMTASAARAGLPHAARDIAAKVLQLAQEVQAERGELSRR